MSIFSECRQRYAQALSGSKVWPHARVRQNSSQDKKSTRPPATLGGSTAQSAGSPDHVISSENVQVPVTAAAYAPGGAQGRAGRQMEPNAPTTHSHSNLAPISQWTAARDLKQPDSNVRLARCPVQQIPRISAFDKRMGMVQVTSTQRTRETFCGETANKPKQRPVV